MDQEEKKKRAEAKAALKKIKEGGVATKVRILVDFDACPVCRSVEGVYDFDDAAEIPVEGCSQLGGCNAFYAPVLDRRGP